MKNAGCSRQLSAKWLPSATFLAKSIYGLQLIRVAFTCVFLLVLGHVVAWLCGKQNVTGIWKQENGGKCSSFQANRSIWKNQATTCAHPHRNPSSVSLSSTWQKMGPVFHSEGFAESDRLPGPIRTLPSTCTWYRGSRAEVKSIASSSGRVKCLTVPPPTSSNSWITSASTWISIRSCCSTIRGKWSLELKLSLNCLSADRWQRIIDQWLLSPRFTFGQTQALDSDSQTGGIALDSSIISFRPLHCLRNALTYTEDKNLETTEVLDFVSVRMSFDSGHPFLKQKPGIRVQQFHQSDGIWNWRKLFWSSAVWLIRARANIPVRIDADRFHIEQSNNIRSSFSDGIRDSTLQSMAGRFLAYVPGAELGIAALPASLYSSLARSCCPKTWAAVETLNLPFWRFWMNWTGWNLFKNKECKWKLNFGKNFHGTWWCTIQISLKDTLKG